MEAIAFVLGIPSTSDYKSWCGVQREQGDAVTPRNTLRGEPFGSRSFLVPGEWIDFPAEHDGPHDLPVADQVPFGYRTMSPSHDLDVPLDGAVTSSDVVEGRLHQEPVAVLLPERPPATCWSCKGGAVAIHPLWRSDSSEANAARQSQRVAYRQVQPGPLQDHQDCWEREYESLRQLILIAIPDLVLGIDHVGSTAVPGLIAKPIIDVDLTVP